MNANWQMRSGHWVRAMAFILVAWLVAPQAATSQGVTQLLMPDRFTIRTDEGEAAIRIDPSPQGGAHVRLVFVANYEEARTRLRERLGAGFDATRVLELPIEATSFRFLTETIENSHAVRSVEQTLLGNQILVDVEVSSDLTIDQIKNLFTFNLVYGVASARVICPGGIATAACAGSIPSLPVYNGPKAEALLDAVTREARRTFGVLNEFKTRLFLGFYEVSSNDSLDLQARRVWNSSTACSGGSTLEAQTCSLVRKVSTSGSLSEALAYFVHEAFPERLLARGLDDLLVSINNDELYRMGRMRFPALVDGVAMSSVAVRGIEHDAGYRGDPAERMIARYDASLRDGTPLGIEIIDDTCGIFRVRDTELWLDARSISNLYDGNVQLDRECGVSLVARYGSRRSNPAFFTVHLADIYCEQMGAGCE